MKDFIKKKLTESITLNIVENMMVDEDYPSTFDMEHFKTLTKFAERVRYCEEHLKKIASGSSRIVYMIDNIKVLKLAKNKKGIAQNEVEIEYGQYNDISDIVAQIFDYDEENSFWVEMELATKVKKSDFKTIVGYSFEDYQVAIHNYGVDSGNSKGFKYDIDKELADGMWENEFMYEMFSFIGNYSVPTGDLERLNSYGVVKRDGQDKIVLIDYGITHKVYSTYYS